MKKEAFIVILLLISGCSSQGTMEIYFFDVGQGDSALIITPENKTVLVDCGKDKSTAKYLSELNITKLDALVISHNDIDHSGGCRQVMDSVRIEKIYTNKNIKKDAKLKLSKLSKIELIAAYDTREIKKSNDKSLLLKITHGKTKILFTGDCERKCENEILRTENLDIDVLKVGHHGSKSSTSKEFLKETTPMIAVISTGENSYGHPHNETLQRLKNSKTEIYRTDKSRTIKAKINKNTITVEENKKYIYS